MNLNLDTRTAPLTDAEFRALPRNADGDLIDLYDAYPWVTAAQRDRLTGDDYTRFDNVDEEMRCMLAEFEAGM